MDNPPTSFVPTEVEGRWRGAGDTPFDFARDERMAFALYVHWPFCVSKCPYCDFNSHVRASVDQQVWRAALLQDLAHEAAVVPEGTVTSIFFGGGTPSLMPPSTVAAVIAAAGRHWQLAPDIEITLEANPSSVEAARFADLAAAGVNRASLGLQSLDDDALRFLGRAHDVAEGLAALKTAQQVFDRVSFDLIYALPEQSEAKWSMQLLKALSFGTAHLSIYQLTIEPGTRFAALAAKGALTETDPDHGARLYELTQELAGAAGLPAYEISNHARPGEESRHNLTYWRYGTYLGVGPGAHGQRGGQATQRHRKPENWLSALARNGHGISVEDVIAPDDAAVEALLMGLRLREGVDLERIARLTGRAPQQIIDESALDRLTRAGLLVREGSCVAATPAGMLLLDRLLAELIRA